ncbi:MAG TPA: LysR family transcriptional regulator [Pseudolabrys sp.]|nr:LysR family transcriptional regulator [Pseudolabrys sp.]
MNLRQLQYFVEVSELESVTKAAERLHVAQPALSRHMRALESDLGVRLFDRDGRGIVLTNAGLVFRDRVRLVLRELDRAQLEVKALSRSPGGRIDFGMPFSVSQALTRTLVARVHEELPGVALRVIDGWTGFIIEWLLRGRLDLGIIYDHTLRSDVLRTEPLAAEEHFLVCSPRDSLAQRETMTLMEVADLPLALPSREHGLRLAVEEHMQTIGRVPRIETELESIVGLKQYAHQGELYTILPRGEMEEDLASGKLRIVRLVEPTIYRKIFIAWSNERPNTPQMKAVQNIARRELAAIIKKGAWGTMYLS